MIPITFSPFLRDGERVACRVEGITGWIMYYGNVALFVLDYDDSGVICA